MVTVLNTILRGLMKNALVKEYDTGDWHVVKHASGWVEITGMLGVNYSGTSYSQSTGFHCRSGAVTLPVTLDLSKPIMAMATDSSLGVSTLRTRLSGENELTIVLGTMAAGPNPATGLLTSVHVAGYEKG